MLNCRRSCNFWVKTEFTRPSFRVRFDQLTGWAKIENLPDPDFPRTTRQSLLCALRLATILSFRSLEGTPFRVNVLMVPINRGLIKTLYLIFDLREQNLYLNFDHMERLEKVLEVVQSEDLCLVACERTGRCQGLYHLPSSKKRDRGSSHRQQWFCELFKDCGDPKVHQGHGFFFGHGGRVEVYGQGALSEDSQSQSHQLLLYRSGPEWTDPPISTLNHLHEREPSGKSFVEWSNTKILEATLLTLLDHGLSSIIVVLPESFSSDEEGQDKNLLELHQALCQSDPEIRSTNLGQLGLQEMREELTVEIEECLSKINLKDLDSVSALTALFQTDGAHFITHDGRILALSMRVTDGQVKDGAKHAGSGSSAASLLAEKFPFTHVIKVSAGGKFKYYHETVATVS